MVADDLLAFFSLLSVIKSKGNASQLSQLLDEIKRNPDPDLDEMASKFLVYMQQHEANLDKLGGYEWRL